MLTTHPHLVPRSRMSRSYTPLPPNASMACSGTALPLHMERRRRGWTIVRYYRKICLTRQMRHFSRDCWPWHRYYWAVRTSRRRRTRRSVTFISVKWRYQFMQQNASQCNSCLAGQEILCLWCIAVTVRNISQDGSELECTVFVWRDRGKLRKTSVGIVGLRVEIWSRGFPNMKYECQPLNHDVYWVV
jgi:hypothetical protein